MFGDVLEFMVKNDQVGTPAPKLPDYATVMLRLRLMAQEYGELVEAMASGDLVAIADAIADLTYVVQGTAVAYGIDIRPVWNLVHHCNMQKSGGKDMGGKVLKDKEFIPPEPGIKLLLENQEPIWQRL